MSFDADAFGKSLFEARQSRGLSQKRLGKAADVSYTYISKLENAKGRAPSIAVLYKLGEALGIDPRELLPTPTGRLGYVDGWVEGAVNAWSFIKKRWVQPEMRRG